MEIKYDFTKLNIERKQEQIRTRYRKRTQELIRASLLLRGGFSIISISAGLKPRAVAGGPSVTKLTHRSCTGIIHSGIPSAAVKKMDMTSPTFDDIMYLSIEGREKGFRH